MKKDNKKYYLLSTPPNDFLIDIENNFSIAGFPERNKNSVKKFKKGDRIVYYITKKHLFGAITEVTGEHYYSREQVWSDWFNLFPNRIKTKPIFEFKNFDNMIFIKDIWDDLSFIKEKKKWGAYLQGSFRNLNKKDYQVIENEFKKRRNKQ